MSKPDYREHVSRADLHYEHTVKRSEGGLPVGNGRMGSLIWTSPSAVKLQINRVDVYASDGSTLSFNQRHTDYAYACGFVDIDFVDYGEDVFRDGGIRQHLSMYDAVASICGEGVRAEAFAYDHSDVFAFRVEDSRDMPQTINVRLKMLRPAEVVTKQHSAISTLSMLGDMIVLKQEFREGAHYCSSAVVIGISGRKAVARMNDEFGGRQPVGAFRKTKVLGQPGETEMRLCIEPGAGEFELFIASAAAFDETEDAAALAAAQLESARTKGYAQLLAEHKAWWNDFWTKSYIRLNSADGKAEFVETHYTYYLYLMASNSRGGHYPPNFGGMLLSPRGDLRHWGAMQWWNNLNLYYNAVLPSGHFELMHPLFDMYSGMYEACRTAARQQWGSEGIYIPEVTWFNGPAELPDDIAEEMRELYLFRKPWEERSARFTEYAYLKPPHESRWNWKWHEKWIDGRLVYTDRGYGPFGATTFMFLAQAEVAYHFWLYYEYTRDEAWLRGRAYPMIRGVAEFFRHLPLVRKDEDGLYHIYHTCSDEKYFDGKDTVDAMAAMHFVFPALLRASEILGEDEELRTLWQEFYDHLAPLPRSDHPEAVLRTEEDEPAVWVGALGPVLDGRSGVSLNVGRVCDLISLETAEDNPDMFRTTIATFEHEQARHGGDWGNAASEMSTVPWVLANLGKAEPFKQVVLAQLECRNAEREYCYFEDTGRVKFFENRLTVREGVNCISAQRLGNAAVGLQSALCQSRPAGPGKPAVIRVFPACPDDWDAQFSLWCRGGFVVTSERRGGEIPYVEIESTLGGICRIRNPWGERQVIVRRGDETSTINGSLLEIDTEKGSKIRLESFQ
ncbi:glycosyl hydrolase family 95 catalytic domain-containing protein [Paenibacillus hamazuiensis]|uniref:glycosyl hydrolase family 95 catalytic domain-containing protein n=1 Tax=Paenibacillus hamazuiensis TaxID=2936508 RepID=UPI00200FFAC1|nr:hypothetical protein [Paenibacillus hamazuiensis]